MIRRDKNNFIPGAGGAPSAGPTHIVAHKDSGSKKGLPISDTEKTQVL
jgi:hypothetical protein